MQQCLKQLWDWKMFGKSIKEWEEGGLRALKQEQSHVQ